MWGGGGRGGMLTTNPGILDAEGAAAGVDVGAVQTLLDVHGGVCVGELDHGLHAASAEDVDLLGCTVELVAHVQNHLTIQ